ncbi:hypothetical protein NGUA25_00007 [Salmonella enterica]|nr:hypothetical protein NGUA25_00007 [Salmonella enterica]
MTDSNHIAFRSFNNCRLLFDISHTENGNLRLINYRSTKQRLESSKIGNRKRTTRNVIRHQFIITRFHRQSINGHSQTIQIQPVGIMYHRNNQISIIQ